MINYKIGSLFNAPVGSVIVHSCNCQGTWGAGVAAQIAERFPEAEKEYIKTCKTNTPNDLLGKFDSKMDNYRVVVSLFTSSFYGTSKDNKENILNNTEKALELLFKTLSASYPDKKIHMPMINSGLFGVPWKETEVVLTKLCNKYNTEVTVWRLHSPILSTMNGNE